MSSKALALLLDLGVTKSHSRPHDDNPYSIVKYREFPARFGTLRGQNLLPVLRLV